MLNRTQLKKLAKLRLKEAKALYEKKLYDGSLYLAGYVVELSLKSRICKVLHLDQYPDESFFKTHKHDRLKLLGGLREELATKLESKNFRANWSIVTEWSPDFRYNRSGTTEEQAGAMLQALEDPKDGVFTWLRMLW